MRARIDQLLTAREILGLSTGKRKPPLSCSGNQYGIQPKIRNEVGWVLKTYAVRAKGR